MPTVICEGNSSAFTMINYIAQDIAIGITSDPKRLSSKYFYDDTGSRLFEQIMELPEYYLTRAEMEILSTQSNEMATIMAGLADISKPIELMELGAGNGSKAIHLLSALRERFKDYTYMPVDISEEALEHLQENIRRKLPGQKVIPIHATYKEFFSETDKRSGEFRVLVFLGSNIGNFNETEIQEFLIEACQMLREGELFLLGADLKKNPFKILNAYNDNQGVTAKFNLNILERINREFEADFDIGKFTFFPTYNPITGEVRSYLVSETEQSVHIKGLDLEVHFKRGEAIHTEISKKFDLAELRGLLANCGFCIEKAFFDSEKLFADILCRKL